MGYGVDSSEAFRWTTAGGMAGLGDLPGGGFGSQADGVSADGRVVVGFGTSAKGSEAFVWTAATGMRSLESVIIAKGFNPAFDEWTKLSEATAISSDGRYVVGYGTRKGHTEAFLADLEGQFLPSKPYEQPPRLVSAEASLTPLGDLPGGAYRSEFGALSADGRTVVGWSTSANVKEAFRWSLAGGMTGLGDLPGGNFESTATAVSADGSVVAGNGISANGPEAFRWTAAGGMAGLGDLPGGVFSSQATAVSADGSVVVGNGISINDNDVFRWTVAGGLTGLAGLQGGGVYTSAAGVSDDGDTVVGGARYLPFRWAASGAELWRGRGLDPLDGLESSAESVSADGDTVVGAVGIPFDAPPGFAYEGYKLTTVGGTEVVTRLGFLHGYYSSGAHAVSADGRTVVGDVFNQVRFVGPVIGPAFRWTASTGMQSLGDLPGGRLSSSARSVSADGNIIVGDCYTADGVKTFVWTAATGMKSLEAVLLSKGVDPAQGGWTAFSFIRRSDFAQRPDVSATIVSRDGRYVAGTGIRDSNTEAFLADIGVPTPPVVTATFAGGAVTLRWDPTSSAVQQVLRAGKPEGPYTQVASGALAGTYTETPPAGAGQYYRVIWP